MRQARGRLRWLGVRHCAIQLFFPEKRCEWYPFLSDQRFSVDIDVDRHGSHRVFIDGSARLVDSS